MYMYMHELLSYTVIHVSLGNNFPCTCVSITKAVIIGRGVQSIMHLLYHYILNITIAGDVQNTFICM